MSDETLKPCPFCGGEATVERIGKSGYYYVACNTAYCCDFGKFETEAEAIAAWNTRAATTIGKVQVEIEPVLHGTLTAEQVREAVLENFEETYETYYDHWEPSKFDWQAIADELNAALGGGECEVVQDKKGPKCSKCGKELPEDPYSDYEGNFCPTCGARIRKAVKR